MAHDPKPVYYSDLNIAKLSLGAVVKSGVTGLVGHVLGFGMNEYKELTVEVKWCDGTQDFTQNACLYFNF